MNTLQRMHQQWRLRRFVADADSWFWGKTFQEENRVGPITQLGSCISATVKGRNTYETSLCWEGDDGKPWGVCECPSWHERGSCKHLAALGLTWLKLQGGDKLDANPTPGKPAMDDTPV